MSGESAISKGDLLVVLTSGTKYLISEKENENVRDNKNILFIRMPFILTFPWHVILFLAANVQRQQQAARAREERRGTRPDRFGKRCVNVGSEHANAKGRKARRTQNTDPAKRVGLCVP
jgi:hypothetical protein